MVWLSYWLLSFWGYLRRSTWMTVVDIGLGSRSPPLWIRIGWELLTRAARVALPTLGILVKHFIAWGNLLPRSHVLTILLTANWARPNTSLHCCFFISRARQTQRKNISHCMPPWNHVCFFFRINNIVAMPSLLLLLPLPPPQGSCRQISLSFNLYPLISFSPKQVVPNVCRQLSNREAHLPPSFFLLRWRRLHNQRE